MSHEYWSNGKLYEGYTGRLSRKIADKFLNWFDLKEIHLVNRIDIGYRTGTLSESLIINNKPLHLTCFDLSNDYLSFTKNRLKHNNIDFIKCDAQNTMLDDGKYSLVISGLTVNFTKSPVSVLREMHRISSNNAILGLYIWDFADGMEPIRRFWDAAHACNAPNVEKLDSSALYPICDRNNLLREITNAGWINPEVESIEIDANFDNFDDYWLPFLSGQGSAPAFALGLDESVRERVREKLMSIVTTSTNDSFKLRVRAWSAKGRNS